METVSIEIKDFQPSDAEACFRIRSEAFIKLFYDEIGPDGVVAGINAYLPGKYIQLTESMPIFVAFDGETQIGFIASRFIEHTTIEILFLYVRLDYLGKGIGTQLVQYLENWIVKYHPEVKQIVLDTAVPKYNRKFYEKIGYVKTGESECHYPDGSVVAVRLMKEIDYCERK